MFHNIELMLLYLHKNTFQQPTDIHSSRFCGPHVGVTLPHLSVFSLKCHLKSQQQVNIKYNKKIKNILRLVLLQIQAYYIIYKLFTLFTKLITNKNALEISLSQSYPFQIFPVAMIAPKSSLWKPSIKLRSIFIFHLCTLKI